MVSVRQMGLPNVGLNVLTFFIRRTIDEKTPLCAYRAMCLQKNECINKKNVTVVKKLPACHFKIYTTI